MSFARSFTLITLINLLSLIACAPGGFAAKESEESRGSTGYAGFTIGGDKRVIKAVAELAPKIPAKPTVEEKTRSALAESIKSVKVQRLDKSKNLDRFGTSAVRIELQLVGTERTITFFANLTGSDGNFKSDETFASGNSNYSMVAEFTDRKDQRASQGKIVLKNYLNKTLVSTIPIFTRSFMAEVAWLESSLMKPEHRKEFEKFRSIMSTTFAWVSNSVIALGRSFYQVQVVNDRGNQTHFEDMKANAFGDIMFTLSGMAGRTDEPENDPEVKYVSGMMALKRADLIGDAEIDDERTFGLGIEMSVGEPVDVALLIKDPTVIRPKPKIRPGLMGVTANSYLTMPYGRRNYERLTKIVDDWENNFDLDGVQFQIQKLTHGRPRDSLIRALSNGHTLRPVLSAVFDYYEVPAPAALITLVESRFLSGGKWEIEPQKSKNPSTATGPMQLLIDTASGQGMKTYQHDPGVLPPEGDERRYFVPSACGAASYIGYLIDRIGRYDATLAFLAYAIGDGGTIKLMRKSDSKLRFKITYREMVRQHMIGQDKMDYVNEALALYFVTGNPVRYAISWLENDNLKAPSYVLMPKAPLKDPTCRAAIQPIVKLGKI